MTLSEFDSFRPTEPARRRRREGKGRPGRRAANGDGSREMPMVPEPEFSSSLPQGAGFTTGRP